jgi:Ca2+-transporting ATPase
VLCSGQEVSSEQTTALQALLEGSLLCNDSALSKDETNGHYIPNGAPTEVSLITAALKAGLQPDTVKQQKPRVASVPFESEHKVS